MNSAGSGLRVDVMMTPHHISLVVVFGVLTANNVHKLTEASITRLAGAHPLVCVTDFRGAVIAIPPDDMLPIYRQRKNAWFDIPVAQIVSPSGIEVASLNAWHAASCGILRRVFTDASEAWAWAEMERLLVRPRIAP